MALRASSLESLRVFDACARHGNYTRAADELGVSPAAVSQRMRNLRIELGVQLFDRHGPRVSLTPEGEALALRVSRALVELSSALDDYTRPRLVRVSATPTFAARWLAPRLTEFTERFGVAVTLDPSIELKAPGSFDLAVRSGAGDWAGYRVTHLMPIELTPLYSPRRYKPPVNVETPRNLAHCRLIGSYDWPSWFEAAGVQVTPDVSVTSTAVFPTQDLAAAAAIEGAGVALLSPRLFQRAIVEGQLVQPFELVVEAREAYWALVRDHEVRPPVLAFRDWLFDECR